MLSNTWTEPHAQASKSGPELHKLNPHLNTKFEHPQVILQVFKLGEAHGRQRRRASQRPRPSRACRLVWLLLLLLLPLLLLLLLLPLLLLLLLLLVRGRRVRGAVLLRLLLRLLLLLLLLLAGRSAVGGRGQLVPHRDGELEGQGRAPRS